MLILSIIMVITLNVINYTVDGDGDDDSDYADGDDDVKEGDNMIMRIWYDYDEMMTVTCCWR